MEPALARERLASARRAFLATAGPAGPHLVPICFALAGDVLYSAVDAKPKSGRPLRRLENVRTDPRVAVLADHYEDDWSRLWWVRADGRARLLSAGAELDRALAELAGKYLQYRSAPPPGPVLAIDVDHWSSWSGV
jgi:PPOX class probable F420-dependent enzyme